MKTFQKAPLALAISALLAAPAAMAENRFDTDSYMDSDVNNRYDVHIKNDSHTYKRLGALGGSIFYDPNYSGATVDSKQFSDDNEASQSLTKNNATLGSGALQGASGNVGVNVAAGDNNQQANDAALSSSDAATVFGQSASFSFQSASNNTTDISASPNNARMGTNALRNASGNVGVNVAAGIGNAQHNSLAASVNTASGSADATSGGVQASFGNTSMTGGEVVTLTNTSAYLEKTALRGGYVGGGRGSYEGDWAQTNDVYPEIWQGGAGHSGGEVLWGHIDFDDNGPTIGGLKNEGKFEGEESGTLSFRERGRISLGGVSAGFSIDTRQRLVYQENNASLGTNALAGATGNIGVNIAAGGGNMQRNSLSIASSMGGTSMGGGGGEN
ncbi:hypothetical protein LCL99_12725 [Halomonas denitrificans]|uniref:hypothetical protein n=1 Tax=Halomonas TaxID=2745 RepID=UPI001C984C80|nr:MULTISPECIES: hypothetical protein [Halomonas]MBY5968469.1 hypothetical protein [Halomonas denitrificans]MBY5984154.1 hypothetical protein [Halomonas sp. DP5Y7-2]MBY6207726.1 hypothetical protein [Halomonas sp. DP3Y7-2]MBY6228535.1 hypothetical protein [Halomonas sp. DP3Y7-1]MCA0916601.1 hypothetical protein [Halomonas denitrificans]